MITFSLIQRGSFRKNKPKDEIDSLTGSNGLIDLHYMGSSEFEFGAIPSSYRRIMAQFDNYKLIKVGGKKNPLWIFLNKNKEEEIKEALTIYLKKPYYLIECSGFEDFASSYRKRTDFWWEISRDIDFMFFYGDKKLADLFLTTITDAYQNWWLAKSEEEREVLIKTAQAYPF